MRTYYIKLCQAYKDPVWGVEVVSWVKTPLIRVTRNRLGKSTMDFVGSNSPVGDDWKRDFPLVLRE